jgi:hypothetical protein
VRRIAEGEERRKEELKRRKEESKRKKWGKLKG